uniref:Tetraspanin n=1 Tax=Poecilia reticulata TaxID=8081 RepID=A0A3P9PG76_POERE
MAQGCLKCLKYTMCVANFLCFVCGVAVLGFGVYLMVQFNFAALTPSLASLNIPSMLLISGIVITCVSFLGFLGALKENRCLLMTFFLVIFILMLVELTAACLMLIYEAEIGDIVTKDLNKGLENTRNNKTEMSDWDIVQNTFQCCGVYNVSDWGNKIPASCCVGTVCPSRNSTTKIDLDLVFFFFFPRFINLCIECLLMCCLLCTFLFNYD